MKLAAIVVIVHFFPVWFFASGEPLKMSFAEMLLGAGLLSAAGGVAASFRGAENFDSKSEFLVVLIKTVANTTVLGVCFGLIAWYMTADSQKLASVAIGISGLLSLGGLLTVEWATALTRKWLQGRIDESVKRARGGKEDHD